jgi:hypothetical protein
MIRKSYSWSPEPSSNESSAYRSFHSTSLPGDLCKPRRRRAPVRFYRDPRLCLITPDHGLITPLITGLITLKNTPKALKNTGDHTKTHLPPHPPSLMPRHNPNLILMRSYIRAICSRNSNRSSRRHSGARNSSVTPCNNQLEPVREEIENSKTPPKSRKYRPYKQKDCRNKSTNFDRHAIPRDKCPLAFVRSISKPAAIAPFSFFES